jgi:hypothetical protein
LGQSELVEKGATAPPLHGLASAFRESHVESDLRVATSRFEVYQLTHEKEEQGWRTIDKRGTRNDE